MSDHPERRDIQHFIPAQDEEIPLIKIRRRPQIFVVIFYFGLLVPIRFSTLKEDDNPGSYQILLVLDVTGRDIIAPL